MESSGIQDSPVEKMASIISNLSLLHKKLGELPGDRAIAIDLGTTNSVIAFFDPSNGSPEVIEYDNEGIIPSVVCIEGDDLETYGRDAIGQGRKNAEVKRIIGKTVPASMQMSQFENFQRDMSYRLELDGRGVPMICIGQDRFETWEISAKLLTEMKKTVDVKFRQPADGEGWERKEKCAGLVITVPAYFTEEQVTATKLAAEVATFKKDNIKTIAEPVAAAYYEAFKGGLPDQSWILIVDFGGGTFDLSIVKFTEGTSRELHPRMIGGDNMFGGRDFDSAVMHYFNRKILTEMGQQYDVFPQTTDDVDEDLLFDRRWKLNRISKRIKEKLAYDDSASERLSEYFDNKQSMKLSLTRQQFAQICEPLLSKAGTLITDFLKRAKKTARDFKVLLLVGGSTRMPSFFQVLNRIGFTNEQIRKCKDVDKSVALGAAIYSAQLWQNGQYKSGISISTKLGYSISVYVCDYKLTQTGPMRNLHPIFDADDDLPKTNVFPCLPSGEMPIVMIYEGGRDDNAQACPPIASFQFTALVPVDNAINLMFDINEERVLKMRAVHFNDPSQSLGEHEVQYRSLRDQPNAVHFPHN